MKCSYLCNREKQQRKEAELKGAKTDRSNGQVAPNAHFPFRCREKLQKKEAELHGAKTDRSNAQMEKAALERSLKQVQSQTGRLTKDLEKKVTLRQTLPF